MTTTSAETTTTPYEELAAALRGDLITPGDPGYDEARAVYNAMIDKHPAAVARCRDVADVISCVRFGREHGVEIAVRGGGHNAAGLGVWELHPTSAGGAYVNFLMNEGQDRVKASYRGNYGRLAQVKDRYDPDNTFHINQNIQPASGPTP